MATKRYKVEISPAAENDIEEITDHIAGDSLIDALIGDPVIIEKILTHLDETGRREALRAGIRGTITAVGDGAGSDPTGSLPVGRASP